LIAGIGALSLGATARLALRVTEWLIALLAGIVYLNMRAEVREIQHEIEEDAEKGPESAGAGPEPGTGSTAPEVGS